ncbi:MAG: hypothetical protein JNN21_10655 [Candidatus Accumulibacter sp.]|nr:hypothetical protein [Accumulibacter sp.]
MVGDGRQVEAGAQQAADVGRHLAAVEPRVAGAELIERHRRDQAALARVAYRQDAGVVVTCQQLVESRIVGRAEEAVKRAAQGQCLGFRWWHDILQAGDSRRANRVVLRQDAHRCPTALLELGDHQRVQQRGLAGARLGMQQTHAGREDMRDDLVGRFATAEEEGRVLDLVALRALVRLVLLERRRRHREPPRSCLRNSSLRMSSISTP